VLADGEHARIVVPAPRHQFHELTSLDSTMAHKRSAALGTDRPGRSFESASPTRHAIEPRTDPHRAAKHEFLDFLACHLAEEARSGAFDRLVLVAPAEALHELREHLERPVATMLAATLTKDLVKIPVAELATHLETFWTAPADDTD
jgi:protein required for attachment to host cells